MVTFCEINKRIPDHLDTIYHLNSTAPHARSPLTDDMPPRRPKAQRYHSARSSRRRFLCTSVLRVGAAPLKCLCYVVRASVDAAAGAVERRRLDSERT